MRFKITITVFFLLFLFATINATPVWGNEQDAVAAISSTKNKILNGYSAIKIAEAYGANITVFVNTLNRAGSLLSQAEIAYTRGDFDTAVGFASESQNVLNNFIAESNVLLEIAKQQQLLDFLINVLGPIIGAFVVLRLGFAVWNFLKKKYEKDEVLITESPRV